MHASELMVCSALHMADYITELNGKCLALNSDQELW